MTVVKQLAFTQSLIRFKCRLFPREGAYLTYNHVLRRAYEYVAYKRVAFGNNEVNPWERILVDKIYNDKIAVTYQHYGAWRPLFIGDISTTPNLSIDAAASNLLLAQRSKKRPEN
uniref:Uncharacterized protein n=1 Tax=Panagrolaimus superbus TaxID=310955 RepID=A0A914Z274_9BILA